MDPLQFTDPASVTADDLEEIIKRQQEGDTPLVPLKEEEEQKPKPTPAPQQQPKPAAKPQPKPAQPVNDPKNVKGFIYGSGEGTLGEQVGQYASGVFEGLGAAGAGLIDWGVDLVNKIPGVGIPKIPTFSSKQWQGVREAASVILPTVLLGRAALKGGTAAKAKFPVSVKGYNLSKDAAINWLGKTGAATGTGAFVDYVAEPNERDANLAGTLKENWPETWGWISDDWATVDGESPEVFRAKNIKESVILGGFVDIGVDLANLFKGISRTKELTRIIPKDDTASNFWGKLKDIVAGEETAVEAAIRKQQDALDELGDYRSVKPGALDTPTLGIHDLFDDIESGVRTLDDGGAAGALADAARIQQNLGTVYGRLRNFVSEPALKHGLKADDPLKRDLVKMVEESIAASGKFDYLQSNKLLTYDDMLSAGDTLAKELYGVQDKDALKALLEPFTYVGEYGTKQLSDVGYVGVSNLMKQYLEDYVTLSAARAAGLLATQKAGQLADVAQAAREAVDTAGIDRAQEQILDIMEYLMVEKGVTSYMKGRGLANLNLWKRAQQAVRGKKRAEQKVLQEHREFMANVRGNAKTSVDQLREISKDKPEFLVPLQMAWEFTDGKIDTLSRLNAFIDKSLPNITKAFYDGDPEVPNLIVNGAWGNIFNSTLSAMGTGSRAFFSNAVSLLLKPTTIMVGAAARGDMQAVKTAWYMYSAFGESLSRGFKHYGQVFMKASKDPNSVEYIMRDDLVRQAEAQMDIAYSFAQAAQKNGNDGPMALYNIAESLHDLEKHPLLRLGSNNLSALDGFSRAMIASAEARFQALDYFSRPGRRITPERLKTVETNLYNKMFDENGIIKSDAIDYQSKEIALNLDNKGSQAIGAFIRSFPIVRPFMMFPRTSTNLITVADSYSPLGVFMQDYNKLAYKKADEFTVDEIREILTAKGMPFDSLAQERFNMLRYEALGRKAIGTTFIIAAGAMFMADRITGDGLYDKQRQRVRDDLGYKRRSYEGLDGKRYSYDGLGPISEWLAIVATAMDNFDTLDPNKLEVFFQKAAFVLGAGVFGKTPLYGLEPVFDILGGNPAAANRWASSFSSNALAPLGGWRAEFGRIMQEGIRELDQDFSSLMRNRNNWLDVVDQDGSLPLKYSWLDGNTVNQGENFFQRAWNAVMPNKMYGEVSPEAQFLMDIEWDVRPSFMKNSEGVDLDPKTRSELYSLVGKNGTFKTAVRTMMNMKEGKEFRKEFREAQKVDGDIDYRKWTVIHEQLNVEIRRAKIEAEAQLTNASELEQRNREIELRDVYSREGSISPLNMKNK